MKHILFGDDPSTAEIAILIKSTAFFKAKMQLHYISPMEVDHKYFIGFDLFYPDGKKKPTAAQMKDYISVLLPEIDKLGIKNVICADAEYFKKLTGVTKADPHYGYLLPCKWEGYEHINFMLSINYQAMTYNPAAQSKMDISTAAMKNYIQSGEFKEPGADIIHFEYYPYDFDSIDIVIEQLMKVPQLTCDIEAFSLDFWKAGIGTISFAWNEHEGVSFPVDLNPEEDPANIRALLLHFFERYEGNIIWHGSAYDLKVLICELFMHDLQDYKGMLYGLHLMTKNFHDSMLVAYLATNNTVLNTLGLKALAAEFAGNWAEEEIEDIRNIPLPDLLRYNLIDCLATSYVFNKYAPVMVADKQKDLYFDLFLPSQKTLIQTEMCGIPILPHKVQEARTKLQALVDKYTSIILSNKEVQEFHYQQKEALRDEYTAKAKKKVYTLDDPVIARFVFNPNSDTQLRKFLYEFLSYPIIDLTKKGKQPATGADTLKKLKANAKTPEHKRLLDAFVKLGEASIILNTFIPAFEKAVRMPDGSYRLFGNFKLGGTISLRLSSSNPNLMNLPAGSVFGKMIKECFGFDPRMPWIFAGSDFDGLEDVVNTLQTKDPNKIKVLAEGYDGHSFRAYNYWPSKFPSINPNDVNSINSIKKDHPKERSKSKAPSFALQYQGTYITLMNNCGFSENEAKSIEKNYQIMYAVAIKWAADHIERAKDLGYVPLAFGGRLRTPLLAKSGKRLSYPAQSEGRSAGNALTQSYCILTLRAFNEFMERVWASEYKYDILPAITIHDAIYLVFRNNIKLAAWVNKNLIECMAWNELEELQHPVIKISSSMDIYFEDWSHEVGIPKGASAEEIGQVCRDFKRKFNVKNWCGIAQ
jgi:DNA polymerase-1